MISVIIELHLRVSLKPLSLINNTKCDVFECYIKSHFKLRYRYQCFWKHGFYSIEKKTINFYTVVIYNDKLKYEHILHAYAPVT